MSANPKPGIDWIDIEARWRAGEESIRGIALASGVSPTAIRKRAKRQGWPERPKKGRRLVQSTVSPRPKSDAVSATFVVLAETVADIKVFKSEAEELLEFIRLGSSPKLSARAVGLSAKEFDELMTHDTEFAKRVYKMRFGVLALKEQRLDEAGKRGDWKADFTALQAAEETRERYGGRLVGGDTTITVILNVPDPQPVKVVQGAVIDVEPNAI